jgi:hypothetical protein
VVAAEAADEVGVSDEAMPALADNGCAREGRRLRGKAEEDLGEQVVIFQRRRRRRAWEAAETGHVGLLTGSGRVVELNRSRYEIGLRSGAHKAYTRLDNTKAHFF